MPIFLREWYSYYIIAECRIKFPFSRSTTSHMFLAFSKSFKATLFILLLSAIYVKIIGKHDALFSNKLYYDLKNKDILFH